MNSLGETNGTDRASGTGGMADSRNAAIRQGNAAINSQNEVVGSGNAAVNSQNEAVNF